MTTQSDYPDADPDIDTVSRNSEWAHKLLVAFADRLKFEHDVISHRMGWLMTLNSFLIGGSAVLSANNEKFAHHAFLTGALVLICLVGAISNVSCAYSNVWADRAIREAVSALSKGWLDAGEQSQRLRDLARLYGRDPSSFSDSMPDRLYFRDILHPWFLLPAMFTIVFGFSSFFLRSLTDQEISLWVLAIPSLLTGLFVLVGAAVYLHIGDRLRDASNPRSPDCNSD